jgi:hypothetical protein
MIVGTFARVENSHDLNRADADRGAIGHRSGYACRDSRRFGFPVPLATWLFAGLGPVRSAACPIVSPVKILSRTYEK